jgi:hypothetical protein
MLPVICRFLPHLLRRSAIPVTRPAPALVVPKPGLVRQQRKSRPENGSSAHAARICEGVSAIPAFPLLRPALFRLDAKTLCGLALPRLTLGDSDLAVWDGKAPPQGCPRPCRGLGATPPDSALRYCPRMRGPCLAAADPRLELFQGAERRRPAVPNRQLAVMFGQALAPHPS